MTWRMVGQKGGLGCLFVLYPHELGHYFLMTRFANPPKWFTEGPASFFGDKVAKTLGQEPSAVYNRQKLLGFAQKYIQNHCTYCFEARWPEDTGKNDNPDDIHSYGYPITGFNGRVQTAYAKHSDRINVIYVDGHAAPSYPSRLTWGQFWGVFTPGVFLSTQGMSQRSDAFISKAQYDPLQWSSRQE
jgi:prepilin-type processing-associated H-X9-DG protein